MPRVQFGLPAGKLYRTGLDRGVFYGTKSFTSGNSSTGQFTGPVPWNGLVSITENAEVEPPDEFVFDGLKVRSFPRSIPFSATLETISPPQGLIEASGTKQMAKGFLTPGQRFSEFGMTWRTKLGDGAVGDSRGYQIHLLYNVVATPTEQVYATQTESSEADLRQYQLSTTPMHLVGGYSPSSHFILDSTIIHPNALNSLENTLYGIDGFVTQGRLLPPSEIMTVIAAYP